MKKKILIGLAIAMGLVVSVLGGSAVLMEVGAMPAWELRAVQEYRPGEGNIKGQVDVASFLERSEDYAIGANRLGYAVFKNPQKAFKRMKKECKEGLKLIREEFGLAPFGKWTFREYGVYGWQVNGGSEEARKQAKFVSGFVDIYENSFRR